MELVKKLHIYLVGIEGYIFMGCKLKFPRITSLVEKSSHIWAFSILEIQLIEEHLLNTYFCKSDLYMSVFPSDLDFKAKKSN